MKNLNLSWIFLIFLSQSGIVTAASFDCNKAKSASEKLICSNPELSALDERLFDVYKKAKELSNNSKEFRDDQVAAWKYREQNCKEKECVANWYYSRIKHYTQIINNSAPATTNIDRNSNTDTQKYSAAEPNTASKISIINTQPYKMAENYIASKPKMVEIIKNSYSINSYGQCLAMYTSFEADIINGKLNWDDEKKFTLSLTAIALSISRQNFLKKGVAQEHLDASFKSGLSLFKNTQYQVSVVSECQKIVNNFLDLGK